MRKRITYLMLKGQEGNLAADARTQYSVEEANLILAAAGKPPLEFYDTSNAYGYLVDPNGAWSEQFAEEAILQAVVADLSNHFVEIVMANNDAMALGAVEALDAWGFKFIPVFGIDGTEAAKQSVQEDKLAGTVMRDISGKATAVVQIAENLVTGRDTFAGVTGKIEDDWCVRMPCIVYTNSNS